MSCSQMETKIVAYVDGRLKESERLDVEKHLASCAACKLRATEFRAVSSLLDELPQIEPSEAFDLRVHALVAAEPVKRSWWSSLLVSPRVAFAAAMLLLATVWIGSRGPEVPAIPGPDAAVVESADFDVISNFAPLSDLSQAADDDDDSDSSNGNGVGTSATHTM
jgi:anti-sigma factor RsiW